MSNSKTSSGLSSDRLAAYVFYTIGAIWTAMLILPWMLLSRIRRRTPTDKLPAFQAVALSQAMLFVLLNSAAGSIYFGNGYREYDCGQDVMLSIEAAGEDLDTKVKSNGELYWGVGQSPVPLLQMQKGIVYPPQLNGDYTFMLSGDSEVLVQFGYWGPSLAEEWLRELVMSSLTRLIITDSLLSVLRNRIMMR